MKFLDCMGPTVVLTNPAKSFSTSKPTQITSNPHTARGEKTYDHATNGCVKLLLVRKIYAKLYVVLLLQNIYFKNFLFLLANFLNYLTILTSLVLFL